MTRTVIVTGFVNELHFVRHNVGSIRPIWEEAKRRHVDARAVDARAVDARAVDD